MKNCKLFGIIVLIAVIGLATCSSPAGGGGGGAGSTGIPDKSWYDPSASSFVIKTPDELAGLAALVNDDGYDLSDKTVTLGANINLSVYSSGEGWTPIGDSTNFCGTFDGANYTISNLKIDRNSASLQGLFSQLGSSMVSGVVKNVKLTNVNINGNSNIGAIAGFLNGNSSITDSSTAGTINGNSTGMNIGGIVGYSLGTIARCCSAAEVNGNQRVGGIVGQLDLATGKIMNCYSTGNITSSGDNAGGIAGIIASSSSSSVTNCYATGKVTGNDYVGGITGNNGGSITDCAALNLGIETIVAVGANIGCVAGDSSGTFANNVTCGVTFVMGGLTIINGMFGSLTKYGADLAKSTLNGDGTIGGRFTSGNGWTTLNGYLPGFGAVVPMPNHLTTS